jgi:hypothetical protein
MAPASRWSSGKVSNVDKNAPVVEVASPDGAVRASDEAGTETEEESELRRRRALVGTTRGGAYETRAPYVVIRRDAMEATRRRRRASVAAANAPGGPRVY